MAKNRFKNGSWNTIDDVSGFKTKGERLRRRWDGVMVSEANWEPRHPQDFLRAVKEDVEPPFLRPEIPDIFVPVTYASARSSINETFFNGFLING